jgi:hypothetical protein
MRDAIAVSDPVIVRMIQQRRNLRDAATMLEAMADELDELEEVEALAGGPVRLKRERAA